MRHRKPLPMALTAECLEQRSLLSVAVIDQGTNNRLRTAQVAPLDPSDQQAVISGQINRIDRDVYRVTPLASGKIEMGLTDAGRNPVVVEVFNGSGKRLFRTAVREGSTVGAFSVTAGRDVYLRVQGLGLGTGNYQISLQGSTNVDPSTSPPILQTPTPAGQTAGETPTPISFDSTGNATVSGTITVPKGSDTYVLTAPSTGRMTFNIRRTAAIPLTLTVKDASGRVRLTLDSDKPSFISFISAQQGETYTLTITSQGDGEASYLASISQR